MTSPAVERTRVRFDVAPDNVGDAATRRASLDAGLAAARGLTFIAMRAPLAPAAAIVDAFSDEPAVAWSSSELVLAGIGVASEVRGAGDARWREAIAGAVLPRDARAVIDGHVAPLANLGLARPRFIGGASWAPGTADRAPWTGFGDAWFALPRWTYVHDHQIGRAHV